MNDNEITTRQLYFDKKYDYNYNYSYMSLKDEIKVYREKDKIGNFIDYTHAAIKDYNYYHQGLFIKDCYLCFMYKGERYYTMYNHEEIYDIIHLIKAVLKKLGCTYIYFVEGELD